MSQSKKLQNEKGSKAAAESNGAIVSALVEIVGIQGIAEEDVDRFQEKTSHFRNKCNDVLARTQFKDTIKSRLWLDRCYIWSDQVPDLIKFLQQLRSELLMGNFPNFSRAVVKECPRAPVEDEDAFTETAAILAEALMAFKAVGAKVDLSVRDRYLRERAVAAEPNHSAPIIFENCHFTGDHAKQKLHVFWDLAWEQPVYPKTVEFPRVFHELSNTVQRSKKAAKFFSPLLINFARNIMPTDDSPISPRTKNGKRPPPKVKDVFSSFFYHLVQPENMQIVKGMPGGALALLTLIDRQYSKNKMANGMATDEKNEQTDREKRFSVAFKEHLDSWIYYAQYLVTWLDHDNPLGLAPPFILSGESRGKFRKIRGERGKEKKDKKKPDISNDSSIFPETTP